MQNRSTGKTLFEIVYLQPSQLTLDLVQLPQILGLSQEAKLMADKITRIHEEVTEHLHLSNKKYKQAADQKRRFKEYQVGDLVMVFLRKNRFPTSSYHKLQNKRIWFM